MPYVHSPVIGVIGAILIFGLAIFAHEFGHFIMAKLTGVGVQEFAVGMGPRLASITRGGTVYSIRALPIGGFVMLQGTIADELEEQEKKEEEGDGAPPGDSEPADEEPDEKKRDTSDSIMEDVQALRGKPTWVKVAIFTAGVAFNFVAAIVANAIIFTVGVTSPAPLPAVIAEVEPDTIYAEAGLQTLDRIVSINGREVETFEDFIQGVMDAAGGDLEPEGENGRWRLIVERNGEQTELETPPLARDEELSEWTLAPAAPAYVGGVHPTGAASKARPHLDSPVERDGLLRGDMILSINGRQTDYFHEMSDIVTANANEPIEIKVRREGYEEPLVFVAIPKENPEEPGEGLLGVFSGNPEKNIVKEPFLTALVRAPLRTTDQAWRITALTFMTLGKLFTNFNAVKGEVAGPVGIMTMAYQASRGGLESFLNLFIILNLALMVFNMLPIPVLDGGHVVISLIEGATGRTIPPKILGRVFMVFVFLLLGLVVLMTFQDILNWWLKY